ncbi:carbohydrate ABC transporter permease [Mahella australiensis]|uniref:Carbohydrate ABC transporter membrane protein 1, CUT1 family n=1 Tax=Mahella australiensis (strain DSM 15567 / CIP 107919 / 50-1 BON) TaxID=697281 RepID=F4A0T1_MAHA5|nr:sugar ABC transporter permease [Mahella australiensis]AEE96977.1 carbohydrate ABC transporter membrane protein 1, CUT1 family [Mahella australiensis 50-1 BON]
MGLKKRNALESRKAMAGRLFVYPWVIGFLLFFAEPLIQSFVFTFNELKITQGGGYVLKPVGFYNYLYAFTKDPVFLESLADSAVGIVLDVPLIVMFSIFMAVLLNKQFYGRTFVRAVFFLPVVIGSGALLYSLQADMLSQLTGGGSQTALPMAQNLDFGALLLRLTNNSSLVAPVISAMNRVFNVIWKSGVQILLFLAGLQSISPTLYESADVEGATAWEAFWKITFPLLSPVTVLTIIYTIIDSFTDYSNSMLRYILDTAFGKVQYSYASTVAWLYFGFIGIVLLVILGISSRRVFYINE